jgi:Tol biopolymer transport system component
LTPPIPDFHASAFTWAPDAKRGLVAQSDQICSSFAAVDSRGLHPLDLKLGTGGRAWSLASLFRATGDENCTKDGQADHPAFSPDGRQVAFFASPDAVGVSGQARLDVTWGLWMMSAAGDNPHRVLGGLVEPTDVAWSPDGRWLAFNARRGSYRGVWLYSLSTGTHRRVSGTDGSHVAWSPDGHQLVAVNDTGTLDHPLGQLVVYDIAALLGN